MPRTCTPLQPGSTAQAHRPVDVYRYGNEAPVAHLQRRCGRMRRREVLAALGSAALAWSRVAHAQAPNKANRVGILAAGPQPVTPAPTYRENVRRAEALGVPDASRARSVIV